MFLKCDEIKWFDAMQSKTVKFYSLNLLAVAQLLQRRYSTNIPTFWVKNIKRKSSSEFELQRHFSYTGLFTNIIQRNLTANYK